MNTNVIELQIVADITNVPIPDILGRSRKWPCVEARMLFALFMYEHRNVSDSYTSGILSRSRTTILKTRRSAADYRTVSKCFVEKYHHIIESYEKTRTNPQSV